MWRGATFAASRHLGARSDSFDMSDFPTHHRMRIATWNLAGKWSANHMSLLTSLDCEVVLLTELPRNATLSGYELTFSEADMQPGRAWAGIGSRNGLAPLTDPHPASAMALVRGIRICSSVLPWRGARPYPAFTGTSVAQMTVNAVGDLIQARPAIWGGDWNHSLAGREYVGSLSGRTAIRSALTELGLQVPTAGLRARNDGQLSIDHIAVPETALVVAHSVRVPRRLSDHDAYVVEIRGASEAPAGSEI